MNNHQNCSHVKEPLFQYVKDCYWNIFRGNTAILSNTCRQLALGIGGVLLIDRINVGLIWFKAIITLLVLFFISDAIQYLYQSLSFKNLAKNYDKQIENGVIKEISQLVEPPNISKATNILFGIKLFFLAVASILFIGTIWYSNQYSTQNAIISNKVMIN